VLPGGKNVNPEHVEAVLSEARYIQEVLVVPGFEEDSAGITEETVRAIVRPALDIIENETNLSGSELIKQPDVLRNLVWKNVNECQQQSKQLSGFEKLSSHRLEIKTDEFQKTSTGKIKRGLYIKVPGK
jgi:long-subunit acyl-CoA synthetase (AMP-forming)